MSCKGRNSNGWNLSSDRFLLLRWVCRVDRLNGELLLSDIAFRRLYVHVQ